MSFSGQKLEACYAPFMQVAQEKNPSAGVVQPRGGSPDPFSSEAKVRRQRLIAAINDSHSKETEEADAALSEYLDTLYPENAVSP
jgi:hypothetical protein